MPFESATEQLRALQQNEVTSLDLVEATIARIEELDETINAVAVRDFDRARRAALAADRERAAGGGRPLLGLPVTVKEAFDLEGTATTWGLPGTHVLAKTDSTLVDRVRGAGAIVLGKTNVAMMLADWQTTNPVFGLTRNPWDTSRTPGGSSGGGAAAVAAGMTALDFGSDLAGSLRIPAAFCGVWAHRPSHGLVPMRGFAPPMAPRPAITASVDQCTVGPIARHAADLRLALDVVAGPETESATAYRLALPPPRHHALREFRVLVLDAHPLVPTSDDIKGALANVADRLEREGCRVGRAVGEIPDLRDLTETFVALLMSLMGADTPEESYLAAASTSKRARRAFTGPQHDDQLSRLGTARSSSARAERMLAEDVRAVGRRGVSGVPDDRVSTRQPTLRTADDRGQWCAGGLQRGAALGGGGRPLWPPVDDGAPWTHCRRTAFGRADHRPAIRGLHSARIRRASGIDAGIHISRTTHERVATRESLAAVHRGRPICCMIA